MVGCRLSLQENLGVHDMTFDRRLLSQVTGSLQVPLIGYIAVRYLAAILFAVETLLFARLLGPENYGRYALIVQVASLLVFAGIGSGSGYVYSYFRSADKPVDHCYLTGAFVQYALGTVLGIAVLQMFESYLALSGLLFLIYIPYFITEPMLRVRNRFTLVVIGKSLGSLATVTFALGLLLWSARQEQVGISLSTAIALVLVGNLSGYAVYYVIIAARIKLFDFPALTRSLFERATWKYYWKQILTPGVPDNLSSVVFLLFSYVDRLFIERYRSPRELGVYALAWQLSQGAILLLNSLNVISGVRVGEIVASDRTKVAGVLHRQLTVTATAALLVFVALVAGTMLLNLTLYADYAGLVKITTILSVGYIAVSISGSVSSLLTYGKRNIERILAHTAVLLVCVLGNVVAVKHGLWYGVPVLVSSTALIMLSVWILRYSNRLAQLGRDGAYLS
jgi:O-antigen/teichoic acid export membrane protein